MEWFSIIFKMIKSTLSTSSENSSAAAKAKKGSVFSGNKSVTHPNEISMMSDISDYQIQLNNLRKKYITVVNNPNYKLKAGDSISNIAKRFGVEESRILQVNGLTKESAKKLKIGNVLKIPSTRKLKNIRNLNDTASALGVSQNFIKGLKRVEDGNIGDNKFHNTPYRDKAGNLTIGVGHLLRPGDPRKLTNSQVCELLAKDLLKVEDNLIAMLGGQKNYDKLPQGIKEAILDLMFNKGASVIEKTPGLLYCLKSGKYEAAINKLTYNKNAKGQEMSGLNKRRLFEISTAIKIYNGKIPKSNINTAQQVYNRGVELLRIECRKNGSDFAANLAGYNNEVKSYFGNKLKLITK